MNTPSQPTKAVREREIILLLASFMALNAFALDTMLPALPQIGAALSIADANRIQLVIVAYTFGFGASQIFWGPIADRFGRKAVLMIGVSSYVVCAIAAALARDFTFLVIMRFMMGFSGSVSKVLVTAITRDLYEGEAMARVMSLTYMVFMVVPVMAPSIGQLILLGFEWRAIFFALAAYGAGVLFWGGLRLPETLKPEFRRPLDAKVIGAGMRQTILDRLSRGYTAALGFVFGCLITFLASIQQVLGETFSSPGAIGWAFAAIAGPMGVASFANSRIVTRIGLRRTGHGGLTAFAAIAVAHLIWAHVVGSTLGSFIIFLGATMTCFAFTAANLGTLAMTNMAPIAGTASSVQGMFSTLFAAVFGFVVGQQFDGTELPMLTGFAAAGTIALAIVFWTERGSMFTRHGTRSDTLVAPVD